MMAQSNIIQPQRNGELNATDSNSILALIFMAMVPIQDALFVIGDKQSSFIGKFIFVSAGIYTGVVIM